MLNLDELVLEATCRTPLLCLLSTGSDPTENILALAKRKGISNSHLLCA